MKKFWQRSNPQQLIHALQAREAWALKQVRKQFEVVIFKKVLDEVWNLEEADALVKIVFGNLEDDAILLHTLQDVEEYLVNRAEKMIAKYAVQKAKQAMYLNSAETTREPSIQDLIKKEYIEALMLQVEGLPPLPRIVFKLRSYTKLSDEEIAKRLKVKLEEVRKAAAFAIHVLNFNKNRRHLDL